MSGVDRRLDARLVNEVAPQLLAERVARARPRCLAWPGLGLAFPRRGSSLPFRARFGSEGSARGGVDAFVAIVPADAIPRRRVAA